MFPFPNVPMIPTGWPLGYWFPVSADSIEHFWLILINLLSNWQPGAEWFFQLIALLSAWSLWG
tara:strand:- start:577 stop:765 length:189 start_codon:yes stop_codon:yes gene_type:complete